jgi:transposase
MEGSTMNRQLVSDELWALIEPILPKKPRRYRYPGRKPADNRKALAGIIFVLKTGIPWEDLPLEFGCCGMTCWRRLAAWNKAGVWAKMHQIMLSRLRNAEKINWNRAIVDSSSVRAVHGGSKTGPNPTDRAKPGSKHHLLSDARGIPLSGSVTAANKNDITELKTLVEGIAPVKGRQGRARRRPKKVQGDRGYDSEAHRQWLRQRGITPLLARRRTPHGSGLGVHRWVIERTIAWLHQFRRLRVRYERRSDIHEAFVTLAMALIAFRFL